MTYLVRRFKTLFDMINGIISALCNHFSVQISFQTCVYYFDSAGMTNNTIYSLGKIMYV